MIRTFSDVLDNGPPVVHARRRDRVHGHLDVRYGRFAHVLLMREGKNFECPRYFAHAAKLARLRRHRRYSVVELIPAKANANRRWVSQCAAIGHERGTYCTRHGEDPSSWKWITSPTQ